MKVQLVSDLHLDHGPLAPFESCADVVVIAGDTHRDPDKFSAFLRSMPRATPIVVCAGNHEFDKKPFHAVHDLFRKAVAGLSNVYYLERESVALAGVTFHGATLWTDMNRGRLTPPLVAMLKSFRYGDVDIAGIIHEHERTVAWLESLAIAQPAQTVIVTHMAPTLRSVAPKYFGDPCNGFFASDRADLVERLGVAAWMHGHVHHALDYQVGDTRVVGNPRGYVDRGENPGWTHDRCIVEIGRDLTPDAHAFGVGA